MEIHWNVTPKDVERVREFVASHEGDPFVLDRKRRNLTGQKPIVGETTVWKGLVACLLTTQQRSGPGSAISRFMRETPFPLSYGRCVAAASLGAFATRTLAEFGGIRRSTVIGQELESNLPALRNGLWRALLDRLNGLRSLTTTQEQESDAAEFLAEHLDGLGPKQSRNLLQGLGLTRYEIPIDSRLTKWLNEFGFPVRLSATALADPAYYHFVSEGIRVLCEAAGIYPCILDAAVFVSFDPGQWNTDDLENWRSEADDQDA